MFVICKCFQHITVYILVIGPSSQPHISLYPWDWLKSSSYDPPVPNRDAHLSSRRREKVLWGSGIVQDPPTVEFEQVMNEERELWKWLSKIVCHLYLFHVQPCLTVPFQDTFGFCFITGVPATLEDTERLSRKLGDIRRTHCKRISFIIFSITSDIITQMANSGISPPTWPRVTQHIPTWHFPHIPIVHIS